MTSPSDACSNCQSSFFGPYSIFLFVFCGPVNKVISQALEVLYGLNIIRFTLVYIAITL